jgi:hypothetical protein
MTMPDTRSGGRGDAAIGDEQGLPGTVNTGNAGAETGSGAREQIRQARDKVIDQAKSTFRDARERAGSSLSDGRRQAAEQIGGIGGALHRTSEQLRSEDQARFADVADSVGRQIDKVAGYLRDSDGRTIARDLEGLARRQPALVFAGAFALGLVAARFLKSSDPGYTSDDANYERIRPGGEPAGLGSGFNREAGGFDAPA